MTVSIYKNDFVFEKHGPHFSEYIGICIKHHKDKKGKNTEHHHIYPKHCGGTRDIWNMVHLEFELHVEAHRLLMEAFSGDEGMKNSYNWTKNRGSNRGEGNPMYGKPGLKGEANGMFGRTGELHHAYGKPGLVGELNPWFGKFGEDHPAYGNTPWNKDTSGEYSEEYIRKLKYKAKNRTRKTCPFCGKKVQPGNFEKHVATCINNPNRIRLPRPTKTCTFCGLHVSDINFNRHEAACIENPESKKYKKKHKIE